MRPQAEFWICYTVFSPLENGRKKVLKKASNGVELLWMTTYFSRKIVWLFPIVSGVTQSFYEIPS
jgi:hypothetical protein